MRWCEAKLAKVILRGLLQRHTLFHCLYHIFSIENANSSNEEGIDNLEKQLKDAVFMHTGTLG